MAKVLWWISLPLRILVIATGACFLGLMFPNEWKGPHGIAAFLHEIWRGGETDRG